MNPLRLEIMAELEFKIFDNLTREKHYESELFIYAERMSNNSSPKFSDTEVITVYLWGVINGHEKVKSIYTLTLSGLPFLKNRLKFTIIPYRSL